MTDQPELVLMALCSGINDQPQGAVNLFGAGAPVRLKPPVMLFGDPLVLESRRSIVFGFQAPGFDGEILFSLRLTEPDTRPRTVYRYPLDFDGSAEMRTVSFALPGNLPAGKLRYEALLDGVVVGSLPVWITYEGAEDADASGTS